MDERRCLVVDDQPLVRLGVRRLLAGSFAIDEVAEGEEALRMVTEVEDFDVAIVDTGRPPGGEDVLAGRKLIRALHEARPGLEIVAHGDRAERHLATEAIRAGARAYVAKSSPAGELTHAVEAAMEAEAFIDPAASPSRKSGPSPSLTRRQRQVLQLFADGSSTELAARSLGLSPDTVRTHSKGALARLGAHDRAHAVAIALRGGFID